MSERDNEIVTAAAAYVAELFTTRMNKHLVFHSLAHTRDVVNHSGTIAAAMNLPAEDRFALTLACWFHDTGYSAGAEKIHEEESQRIATDFLKSHGVSDHVIEKVNKCIIATRMPQTPTSVIEQIICDADLFHLGTPEFTVKNKLLRQEINAFNAERVTKKDWRKLNIEFLRRHRYFTEYARTHLEPVKQQHLRELSVKVAEDQDDLKAVSKQPPVITPPQPPVPEPAAADGNPKAKKDDKQNRTERGIVTMFRIMSESHVNLSQMADSKANIMISVNTIVISIMVSVLLDKLQFYPEFIIPTIILVSVCLAAVIFAILATRPNISRGTFTKEDISDKKVNLLFFGNFYNMELPDYDWAMKEMMNDREYLYGSMIKDMYYLGVVLARKYKFLRVSYNIFMYGLVAAIVAFSIAFIASGTEA